jgi:ABC-type uncharacterized transport system involved in gliding motility auxiliary subunit
MKKYLQQFDTLGLVLLVAAALRYSVTDIWDKWNIVLAIVGGVFLVTGVVANYRQILTSLGKRSTKYAGNYLISVILVIAVVAGLNYIGQKHPKRFDMTAIGRYTLAPQTVQLLKNLNKTVEVKAFFPGGESPSLKELLAEYRTETSHIRYEFVDPDKHPELAKQNNVTVYGVVQDPFSNRQVRYGTVIVTYGDKTEKIEKSSAEVQEEDLTNAIIKVKRAEIKKIYFVQGHGEKELESAEQNHPGYSEAKKKLEDQGYKVEALNLAIAGKVPDDAKVLVIAGPTTEPFPQEIQFIKDYLDVKGGAVLTLIDPPPAASLETLFKEWGIKPDTDLVLDISAIGRLLSAGPSIPVITKYENHKITQRLRNTFTFFPLVRSIRPDSAPPSGVIVEPLFKSSENSWGETNFASKQASFDPKVDIKGPLPLAVAATKEIQPSSDKQPARKSRMVAVGNSAFAMDGYFAQQGNGNLFLNMVSWLAQDEDLISIRPRNPEDRRIVMTQNQLSTLRLYAVVLLPGIALVVGVIVVVRRRRR